LGDEHVAAALLPQACLPARELTIWQSPSIDSYLKSLLEDDRRSGNHIYLVEREGGEAVGAILMRIGASQFFNQMIIVSPAARGLGLGNILLCGALEACSRIRPDIDEVAWDVFEGSGQAETWYGRLGAVETDRRGWWVTTPAQIVVPEGAAPYLCRGLAEAERMHKECGFSSFEVLVGDSAVEVGRLPEPYFRVLSREAIEDPRFLHTLSAIDSRRGILHLGTASGLPAPWQLRHVTRRLQFGVAPLLDELKKRIDARATYQTEELYANQ
jgi:hypothetical protein